MDYRKLRDKNNRQSNVSGILLAVGLHAALAVVLLSTGLTYLDPPPPEESFVIDFTQVIEEEPMQQRVTTQQPQVEEPDKTREHELVKRSEAQHVGKKANKAPEATVGDKGDVEVKEPPREKPIDKRALFSAANNKADKDTLAPQTASSVSDKLTAGHPKGNTTYGKVDGEPNGVKGRSVVNGNIPIPNYPVQESGIVVVAVKVNQYGKVVEAKPGAPGTTTSNGTLWAEARKAAMKTVFNQAADAPVLQDGTITYKFNLK
ncbi:MAG: cell envelope integrity protein TolA [Bacteroidales bacterium]|nr:cell envelope integrity protein TolA [Bacteroidales bacterium]MBQ9186149.1 cell envelope integrity protein TolA [Bacteroidales bacterium]